MLFIHSPEAYLRTTENSILYVIILRGPAYHSRKVSVWLRQNNDMQIAVIFAMHKCVCDDHINCICQFSLFIHRKCVTATVVWATSVFCAFKTDRRSCACMIKDAIATAGSDRHCIQISRENWNAWVIDLNRFNILKYDAWAIIFY